MDVDVNSFTTARLAALVVQLAHSMSGTKGPPPKISAKDYLPFGGTTQTETASEGPSEATKLVLIEVMKRGAIPPAVFHTLYSAVLVNQE